MKYDFGNKLGLQGLACGLVGVALAFSLDQFGMHRISMLAGITVAITLMLIVLGWSLLRSAGVWAAIIFVTLINAVLGLFFFYLRDDAPAIMAPILLLELVAYFKFIDRMKRNQTRA